MPTIPPTLTIFNAAQAADQMGLNTRQLQVPGVGAHIVGFRFTIGLWTVHRIERRKIMIILESLLVGRWLFTLVRATAEHFGF